MDKATIYNTNLCRICQCSSTTEISSLADISTFPDKGVSFWDALKYIFRDIMWIEDSLKSVVCKTCLKRIYDIAVFKSLCLETYDQRLCLQLKENEVTWMKYNEKLDVQFEEMKKLNDNLIGAAILPQWWAALKRNERKVISKNKSIEKTLNKIGKGKKMINRNSKSITKGNIQGTFIDENVMCSTSDAAILPQWPTECKVKEILKDYNKNETNAVDNINSVQYLDKNRGEVVKIKENGGEDSKNVNTTDVTTQLNLENVKHGKEKINDNQKHKNAVDTSLATILQKWPPTIKFNEELKRVSKKDENLKNNDLAIAEGTEINKIKIGVIKGVNFILSDFNEKSDGVDKIEKFKDLPLQYSFVKLDKEIQNINRNTLKGSICPLRRVLIIKKISRDITNSKNAKKIQLNVLSDPINTRMIAVKNIKDAASSTDQQKKDENENVYSKVIQLPKPIVKAKEFKNSIYNQRLKEEVNIKRGETSKNSQQKRKRKENLCETVRRTFSNEPCDESISEYVDYMPIIDTNCIKCYICWRKFDQVEFLERHMCGEHNGERRYTCSVCERKYVTRSDMIVHSVAHAVEEEYECDICPDKRFKTLQGFWKHNIILRHVGANDIVEKRTGKMNSRIV